MFDSCCLISTSNSCSKGILFLQTSQCVLTVNLSTLSTVQIGCQLIKHITWYWISAPIFKAVFVIPHYKGKFENFHPSVLNKKSWGSSCVKLMYNPQDSTITIKSTHVIKYLCQSFGVRNVRGQIPKSIYQASYFLPSDCSNNFPQACSYCKKLILKFHSNKKIQEDISKKYTVWRECKTLFFSHF